MLSDHKYTESEEKIFAASLEVFGREGKNGARLQEIADRAGINKALIHYYFRSKDRLYEEVFTFVIRRVFLQMGELLKSEDSFEHVLRDFISRYHDFLQENPTLPLFLLREISAGAPVLVARIRQTFAAGVEDSTAQTFVRRVEAAVRNGEIRSVDPVQTFITILGSCIYYFAGYPLLSQILPSLKDDPAAFVASRKDHLFDIFMNGMKPRPELHT